MGSAGTDLTEPRNRAKPGGGGQSGQGYVTCEVPTTFVGWREGSGRVARLQMPPLAPSHTGWLGRCLPEDHGSMNK